MISSSSFLKSYKKGQWHYLPLKLDLTLEVLEEDEVLQKDVPPEVAVAELQVHQLQQQEKKKRSMSNVFKQIFSCIRSTKNIQ